MQADPGGKRTVVAGSRGYRLVVGQRAEVNPDGSSRGSNGLCTTEPKTERASLGGASRGRVTPAEPSQRGVAAIEVAGTLRRMFWVVIGRDEFVALRKMRFCSDKCAQQWHDRDKIEKRKRGNAF